MFTKEIKYNGSISTYIIWNIIFNALLIVGFILEIIPVAYLMTGLIWFGAMICLYVLTVKDRLVNVSLNKMSEGHDNYYPEKTGILPVPFFVRTIIDSIGLATLLYSNAFVTAIGYCIYIASREALSKWLINTLKELKEENEH